ncbi:gliding motility-associated C-terminal domain-containing protein [Cytophaga aurantiaca]|uniref:T9SS type B sorting domain-containing protein n=1 Tax=Cytophaga aurantiaca TaxID=29530 RepID=UPI00037109A2|nr:gliding motility-associated C-terminal domain-containing protein [Cytophaga aurantiaca]
MKKNLLLVLTCLLIASFTTYAQVCPTDLLSGQNLIVNGDFSDGFNNWDFTHDSDNNPNTGPDGYVQFTSGFSVPGYLFVGTGSQMPAFNNAFSSTFSDHSPSGDDKFLMVDGVCILGVKIWKQDVAVKPNTNYYFSVWVNSLKDNPNYPGKLNFDVNGQNLNNGDIDAPQYGGANPLSSGWQKFEAVWNSGSNPPAVVTISIEGKQLIGCGGNGGESDFALDDISFIPGCTYGSSGPQPNLGPDKTLCGLGAGGLVLDAGVPHTDTTTVTWSANAPGVISGSGMGAPYSKIITTPGTYSVCVTAGGSCTKSDIVVISDVYSIDLGPDRELCDPASVTLDAGYTGIGVTYKWYKDGVAAEGININQTYFVNTPGTYKVEVRDPICGLQTDEVIITTKAPQVTNQVYCDPGSITLNVTPNNSGKYKWWTSPTSTADADLAQKGGDSYTFTATPTADYTFYVQDTASFRIPVGLPLTGNGLSGGGDRSVQSETELKFDVLTGITIDSVYVQMHLYNCPSGAIQLQVKDALGNIVGTSALWTPTAADGCVLGSSVILKMPVGISVPVGTGYVLKMITGSNMNWYQNGMTYPQTYGGVISFTGNSTQGWANNAIPGMYRWIVTAGTACARVPVKAIYKSCVPPVPPTSDAGTDIKLCNTHTTLLNAAALATDESGSWTFATGSLGTVNPATSPTATITFTGDTAYVVWTVRNTTSGLLDSDTVMVTTTIVVPPTISAPTQACPGTTGLIFTASPDNTATGSTYQWTIVNGDITFVSGDDTYQLTADAGVTKSTIKVTETKNGCSAFTLDSLLMSPSNDVANAGADQIICSSSTTLTGNIPVNGTGTWIAVTSDPNQVITQVPPNKATVSNLSTNTVYEYMYQISGACGIPTTAIVKVSVGTGGFEISSIAQPLDTICVGSARDLKAYVTGGSGSYTYVWTKKGASHSDEKSTPDYTVTTSSVSETYYLFVRDNINTSCVTDLDSVKITSIDFQKLSVPNLITPNGDGLNDVLKITEVGNLNKPMLATGSTLLIYNRWGNEVFKADNYNNDWKALHTSDGMYYYYLKAGCGGEIHKSWIQILGNNE